MFLVPPGDLDWYSTPVGSSCCWPPSAWRSACASAAAGRDTTSWPRLRRWLRSQPGRWVPRAVIAVGVLAVLVAVVAVLPPRFTAHRDFDKASEQLKAQHDVRATLTRARQARSVRDQGVFYGWSSVCLGVGDGAVLSLASGSLPGS